MLLLINKIHMSNIKVPSFKLLAGFEAAARLGNFSRAADELFISQSAISHQIQQLEAQIGQKLFRRVGRGIELTMAGVVLQKSALRSLDIIRSGLGHISTYLDPGLVVLVCPAHVAHGWLQPRLDDLIKHIPDICPVISTDETARYIDELDVDITITSRPLSQMDVESAVFLQDEIITVCSKELADTLAKIPSSLHSQFANLLCLESDMTDETTGKMLRDRFDGFRKTIIYDDSRLLLDAVMRGRGIACISSLLASDALITKKITALKKYPALPLSPLWVSRTKGETRSPLVTQLFDWLITQSN
jgi:DNA-binding transcriptional LysR family regulator